MVVESKVVIYRINYELWTAQLARVRSSLADCVISIIDETD